MLQQAPRLQHLLCWLTSSPLFYCWSLVASPLPRCDINIKSLLTSQSPYILIILCIPSSQQPYPSISSTSIQQTAIQVLYLNKTPSEKRNSPLVYHLIELMPRKHSRFVQYHRDNKKRRMRRTLRERLKTLSKKQFTFRTCSQEQTEWQEEQHCQHLELKPKRKIFKKITNPNLVQTLQYPINTSCVFSLYGMITIDETALRNQAKDQSLIKALFNFYSLNEVQLNEDYLMLKIHKNKENYFPISYVVDRFKSHGDVYFYEMAQKIEDIRAVFQKMVPMGSYPSLPQKTIEKYIEAIRGKRAMLRIPPNCLIFTKELLEIGGHSIADIGNECISYRSFISDVFLADNYRGQVNKFFDLYELGKRLRRGEVTQQQYMKLSRQSQIEYIVNKKNNMIKIVTNKYNLAPGVGCWEVEQILGEEIMQSRPKQGYEETKRSYLEEVGKRRLNTLAKLTKIPKNMNGNNEGIICSYRLVQGASSG